MMRCEGCERRRAALAAWWAGHDRAALARDAITLTAAVVAVYLGLRIRAETQRG